MDISWEAVVVGAFVLVPGFTYIATARSFTAPERHRPTDLQISLASLAATAFLLAVEAILLLLVAQFWSDLGKEIERLIEIGFEAYVKEHPLDLPLVLAVVLSANVSIMALAGWSSVADDFVKGQQAKRGISSYRVWVDVIDTISPVDGPATGARVYLTSGGVYWGALANWSLTGEAQGGPDIALWRPQYLPSGSDYWEERGRAVVIPAREIRSIEFYTSDETTQPINGSGHETESHHGGKV